MSIVKNLTGSLSPAADVTALQTDLGDPSTRTNFKTIESLIGVPDAANSCLDDMLRTGFNSGSVTSASAGSVMEMLKFIISKVDV